MIVATASGTLQKKTGDEVDGVAYNRFVHSHGQIHAHCA